MGRSLTLVLGGARSGKSTYALNRARDHAGPVLFVATATAGDEEMEARIAAHRAERPAEWRTVEVPQQIGAAVRAETQPYAALVLDCLTMLASNVLLAQPEPLTAEAAEAAMAREEAGLVDAYRSSNADWIVISNEVGLGLVPPYPLGRIYRDCLGRTNQRLAAIADEVLFMVAGLPMRVK